MFYDKGAKTRLTNNVATPVNRSLGNGSSLTQSDIPEDLPTDRQDLVYSQMSGTERGLVSAREQEEQSLNFNIQDSVSNQDMLLQSQNSQSFQNALIQSQRMLEQAKEETRLMNEQLSNQKSDVNALPLRLPDLVNNEIQVPAHNSQMQSNNFMLTSDPNSNFENHQRFVSLQMMDTISSSDSKQTSNFKTLQSNDHAVISKHHGAVDVGAFDSDYLHQLREGQNSGSALSHQIGGTNQLSPEAGIRGLSNLHAKPNSNTVASSLETDPESSASRKTGLFPYSLVSGQQVPKQREYQIGQRPQASTSQLEKLNQYPHKLQTPQAQNNVASQGMLLLATRPQNYESLSLTNSTEFGQHSLTSSVELAGGHVNHILSSHNRPNILAGSKPSSNNATSNFLANQMTGRSNSKEKDSRALKEDKDWKLPYQNNTILEDLKEEDVSFAYSNYRRDNNSRVHSSQNESKNKIDKQISGNDSSEAGRESAPKSDLSGNANTKRSSAQRKNELSHQDDELIEELARTCFKSGGFYKPDANSHLSRIEDDADVAGSEPEEKKDQRSDLDGVQKDLKGMLGSAHTPVIGAKKLSAQGNDLIKIDESQFVTLSQVQENRAVMSSGMSQSPYKTSSNNGTVQEKQLSLTDHSAITQERINDIPSSAGLISDMDNEHRSHIASTKSDVSNKLFQTQVEHTMGRLGYFQQTQVGTGDAMDLNPLKQDSSSTLEKKAQRLGMGKMVGHQAQDGISTSAGTIIDPQVHGVSATTVKYTDNLRSELPGKGEMIGGQKTSLCQGCCQPIISEFVSTQRDEKVNPLSGGVLKSSFSDHKTMALQNELTQLQQNNSQFLLNSGRLLAGSHHGSSAQTDNLLSSYQRVLCSECASKQLQSSDGATSQYSELEGLRVSHLLNNFNQVAQAAQSKPKEPDPMKQYSSYYRFTNELATKADVKAEEVSQPLLSDQINHLNPPSSHQSIGMNENNSLQSNSELKPTSMLGQPLRLDTDSVSSLDSRLMTNHLIWSQHKQLHQNSAKSDDQHALLESAVKADLTNQDANARFGLKGSESEANMQKMSMLDQKSNTNSLQFLSYLSSTANQQAKQQQLDTEYKYANQHLLSSGATSIQTGKYSQGDYATSSYKTALRNFMDRQLERSVRQPIGGSDSTTHTVPMSRVFRERQSRRMFEDLQNLKGSCAKTYEELEQMHAQVLLSKTASSHHI